MVNLTKIIVDGHVLNAHPDQSILEALQNHRISIPSLCFYRSLGGHGSCSLCMIEVLTNEEWKPKHACLLKPEEGMQIRTESPYIAKLRARAARMILRRGPFANKDIEKMLYALIPEGTEKECNDIDRLGDAITALTRPVNKGCILCGICIRICQKINRNHLTFISRGSAMHVGFVPGDDSCKRCRACCQVCPTGFLSNDFQYIIQSGFYASK